MALRSQGGCAEEAHGGDTAVPLDDVHAAGTLAEPEQVAQRHAEHMTEDHAIDPGMGRDGDGARPASLDNALPKAQHARREVPEAFPAWRPEVLDVAPALLVLRRLVFRDLAPGQPFPRTQVDFAQLGLNADRDRASLRQQFRGQARAVQIAAVDRVEPHPLKALGKHADFGLAVLAHWQIDLADEAVRGILDLAVADQQHGAHGPFSCMSNRRFPPRRNTMASASAASTRSAPRF